MDVIFRYLLCCSLFMVIKSEARLSPCGDAGYLDVVENSNVTFTCDQYTGRIAWRYNTILFGTCPALGATTRCGEDFPHRWRVTYINETSSSMTTSWTSRLPARYGGDYTCNRTRCGLHIIVPAVVSQLPVADITEDDSRYIVHVTAAITKVYSSRGLYLCSWQVGSLSLSTIPDLDPPAYDTNNTADRSGSCEVTVTLPSNTWDHTCGLTVIPGNTHRPCGNNTIDTNVTNIVFSKTTTTTTTPATPPLDTHGTTSAIPDAHSPGSLALTSVILMTVTLVASLTM